MMHRPGEEEEEEQREEDVSKGGNGANRRHPNKPILTGKGLEDARDGEPLSFAEGEELSHKHEDAQDGEYTGEHSAGLHCLEVICRGRQRDRQVTAQTRPEIRLGRTFNKSASNIQDVLALSDMQNILSKSCYMNPTFTG